MKKIICIVLALVFTTFACAFASVPAFDVNSIFEMRTDASLGIVPARDTITGSLGLDIEVPTVCAYYGESCIVYEYYNGTYWTVYGDVLNVKIEDVKTLYKELNDVAPTYVYSYYNIDTSEYSIYSLFNENSMDKNCYNSFNTFISSID